MYFKHAPFRTVGFVLNFRLKLRVLIFFSIFTSIEKFLVNTADIIVKISFYQQMNFY